MKTLEQAGPNADQIKHWNEVAGPLWVAEHDAITAPIRPLGELAMERAALAPGERVLDVGCGSGETTLELARRVGPSGSVVGIDISAPMLDRAREAARAAGADNVRFELADAQTEELPQGAFDALYSRFGVMFFSDPDAAFTNLRRALRSGARLSFVCWRQVTENPWILVPATAVMQHVAVTVPDPSAPGPFAFADSAKVRGILERAGFTGVALEPADRMNYVAGSDADLDRVVAFAMQMGPAGLALRSASDEVRAAAAISVRAALAPYQTDKGVRMQFSVWLVTATAP